MNDKKERWRGRRALEKEKIACAKALRWEAVRHMEASKKGQVSRERQRVLRWGWKVR